MAAWASTQDPVVETQSIGVSQACLAAIAAAGIDQSASVYEAQIAGGIETTGALPADITSGLRVCQGTPGIPDAARVAIAALLEVTGSRLRATGAIGAGSGRIGFSGAPGFSGGSGANYS